MTSYEKGGRVLVPFPFSGQSAIKKRPAVVISANDYNRTSRDMVIMAKTSQTAKTLVAGECFIEDWRSPDY